MKVLRSRVRTRRPNPPAAILAALLLGMGTFAAVHTNASAAEPLEVAVDGERLSVTVSKMPLKEVLAKIGEAAGFRVKVRGEAGDVRPQTFRGLPFEKGIELLVGDNGYVIIREDGAEGASHVAQVLVYGNAGGDGKQVVREPRVQTASAPQELDRGERLRLVRQLAREKDTKALANYLAQDSDASVRRIAATALGNISDDAAAAALQGALTDQDPSVRIRATRGLRLIMGAEAASLLSAIATTDKDPEVRRLTVHLLSELEGPIARAAVRSALNDPDEAVRRAAERANHRLEQSGL